MRRACSARAFPYATLFENVTGSLVMGLLAGYFAFYGGVPQHWRLFLTTGILGGYTTFSTFSLDAALLYERGAFGLAALYVDPVGCCCRSAACSPGFGSCVTSDAPHLIASAPGPAGPSAACRGRAPGLAVVSSFGP